MKAQELLERLPTELTARRVYGEPYEKDGATIIPAVKVRGAGGGTDAGDKDSGGGLAFSAKPAGAFVIKEGKVRWEPAIDITRVILVGAIAPITAAFLFGLAALRRARDPRIRDVAV